MSVPPVCQLSHLVHVDLGPGGLAAGVTLAKTHAHVSVGGGLTPFKDKYKYNFCNKYRKTYL